MSGNEDFAEVLSEILIQINNLEERMSQMDRRMNFMVKRIVKAESRLEAGDKIQDELQRFRNDQAKLNKRITDYMTKKPL